MGGGWQGWEGWGSPLPGAPVPLCSVPDSPLCYGCVCHLQVDRSSPMTTDIITGVLVDVNN